MASKRMTLSDAERDIIARTIAHLLRNAEGMGESGRLCVEICKAQLKALLLRITND